MRTNFSLEQLGHPALAAAERELRACVHCGMCTAACPTYTLLGDELDGPRGRIQLIQGMLENGAAPGAKVVTHIDRCLSCLACVSACPSGVSYARLIDEARAHVERSYRRPWSDRLLRFALGFVLPRRGSFRLATKLGRFAAQFASLLPKPMHTAVAVAAKLPRTPRRREFAKSYGARQPAKLLIALHAGCVQEVLTPAITAAAIRLLTRLGADVTLVEGDGCCGALNHHLGQGAAFERHAKALARDVEAASTGGNLDYVITTASGCGAVIHDYDFFLNEKTGIVGRVRDIGEFLAGSPIAPSTVLPKLRVAYHAPCSLVHGMRQGSGIAALLERLGYEVVTPRDAQCCGSAGVYNVLQPAIAAELQARKAETIGALAADVVASGNIGCLMQIAGAVPLPVVHVVELVDWATGGPVPAALAPRFNA
jgi:glycolate oxidase iron-sulfur subunit